MGLDPYRFPFLCCDSLWLRTGLFIQIHSNTLCRLKIVNDSYVLNRNGGNEDLKFLASKIIQNKVVFFQLDFKVY